MGRCDLNERFKGFSWRNSIARLLKFKNHPALRWDLIRAESFASQPTIHHRIREAFDVAGRLEDGRMRQDRSVHADDVVSFVYDHTPPIIFQITLQLHAERPIIPSAIEPAVNLARLENEAAPLTQADNFFHACRAVAWRRRALGVAGRAHIYRRLHGSENVVEAFVPNAFSS